MTTFSNSQRGRELVINRNIFILNIIMKTVLFILPKGKLKKAHGDYFCHFISIAHFLPKLQVHDNILVYSAGLFHIAPLVYKIKNENNNIKLVCNNIRPRILRPLIVLLKKWIVRLCEHSPVALMTEVFYVCHQLVKRLSTSLVDFPISQGSVCLKKCSHLTLNLGIIFSSGWKLGKLCFLVLPMWFNVPAWSRQTVVKHQFYF